MKNKSKLKPKKAKSAAKKVKSLQLAPKAKNIPDNIEFKQSGQGKKALSKKKLIK